MQPIKNIIFDLGAVLLNLDMNRTAMAFKSLFENIDAHDKALEKLHKAAFFERFETNQIEENEFVETLSLALDGQIGRPSIEKAWSAMLLDVPAYRIEMLRELKIKGYKLYLLSNINSIHLRDVYDIIRTEHGDLDFDALFDKPYYSHLIGRRKPDVDTFHFVLQDANIKASETLFIDDNADNVHSAATIGIQVVHHMPNSDIRTFLKNYLHY
jgi:FMN phosphatase YigB (HAD superfamily)